MTQFFLILIFWLQVSLQVPVEGPLVDKQPRHVHLSLSQAGELVVTWSTVNATSSSLVVVQNEEIGQSTFFRGAASLFVDGGKEKRAQWIHRVSLSGLAPTTLYKYQVGSAEGWSPVYLTRTSPIGHKWSPKLALFGDLGNENGVSLPHLQRLATDGSLDLILHVGDMAYDMAEEEGMRGDLFMQQIEPIASQVPYMTCPGNHEYHYNFSNYKARFSMPGGDNMYYSFDLGPVHFVSISTEFYYFLNYGLKQVIAQYNWLKKDLSSVNRTLTPWIVLFGHRPMYCTNDDRDDCTKFETRTRVGLPLIKWWGLEEVLNDHGVDLAIWAHEHSYERLLPTFNRKVVQSPDPSLPYINPRATVHITTGSAGCREKIDGFTPNPPSWSAFRSSEYGFAVMSVLNSSHLELEQHAVTLQGKELVDKIILVQEEHGPFKNK